MSSSSSSPPQKTIVKKQVYGKMRKNYVDKVQKSIDRFISAMDEIKRWKSEIKEASLELEKDVDSFKKDLDDLHEDESNRLEEFQCLQEDYDNPVFLYRLALGKLKVATRNPEVLMGSEDNLKDFDEIKKSVEEMFSEKNLNLLDDDLEKFVIENPAPSKEE